MESLSVELKSIIYKKESKKNKWWVIISTNLCKAKGNISWLPEQGELLKLTGNWETYQGERQFNFSSALPDIPVTSRARLHYVCKLAIGFGNSLEEKIWEMFSNDWEDNTYLINVISGITETKQKSFNDAKDTLYTNETQLQTISWLLAKGVTFNMALSAWEEWGKDTLGMATSNPYILAELPNYGFSHIDILRGNFGIATDSPLRLESAVKYIFKKLSSNGDTLFDWWIVYPALIKLLGQSLSKNITNKIAEMINDEQIIGWSDTKEMALFDIAKSEIKILEFVKNE